MKLQIFEFINQSYFSFDKGIEINSNFLEANVINIVLLLAGLIYVLRQFLGTILVERQDKVVLAINESEERLQQANIRLNEANKQLEQTQLVIKQIIEEAEITAERVRNSILNQGEIDVNKLKSSSKASIISAENQVKRQIQQQITALAIDKVSVDLKKELTKTTQNKLIDQYIMQLEGSINV